MADETKAAPAEKKAAAAPVAPAKVLTTNPPRQDALPADAVAGDPGAAALQGFVEDQADRHAAQGYRGVKSDTTPRENYTVAGVGRGLPTPETTVVQE